MQLFGVKKWLLAPPRYSGITGAATIAWQHDKSSLPRGPGLPLKCTQGPGDMLLLPQARGPWTLDPHPDPHPHQDPHPHPDLDPDLDPGP